MILLPLFCLFSLLAVLKTNHALLLKEFRVGLHSRECLVVGGVRNFGRLGRGSAASVRDIKIKSITYPRKTKATHETYC